MYFGQISQRIYNGNWTEWSAIWSEIIRVISKSNERAVRVRFEITSMISDQNCTPLSSITTLLNPFWNRPNTGLGQFLKYFIDAKLRGARPLYQVAGARYFWLLESSTVSQALMRAPRQPTSVITSILKSPKYRTWSIQIFYWTDAVLSWFLNKSRSGNAFTSKYAIKQCTTLN